MKDSTPMAHPTPRKETLDMIRRFARLYQPGTDMARAEAGYRHTATIGNHAVC